MCEQKEHFVAFIVNLKNTFVPMKRKKNFLRNIVPEKLKPYIYNRYVFTLIGFIVWMTFFDRNDFILQHSYQKKLKALCQERDYYAKEIEKNKNTITELFTNSKNLERYARERYFMKRDNEDVFVFVDQNNKMLWQGKSE
jgi:cell division protein FtsB